MHTHIRAGVAVSCMKEGLMPLDQISLQFHNRIAYRDFERIALYLDERERIVANRDSHPVMVLRNHGLVATWRSAAGMFYLERACKTQLAATASGRPLRLTGAEAPASPFSRCRDSCRRRSAGSVP